MEHIIKQKSVRVFFNLMDIKTNEIEVVENRIGCNEMYKGISSGDTVVFEIDDKGRLTQKEIMVRYCYQVVEYDSISLRLTLMESND